ncbi:MauE/DoxX family redox-associated membrane protein [Nocardioides sambongensis]|uniref:MauE/DoxX family redox-associated membrane protein n=1 Tax=Nocardioides sambongensis TaxID=2589074 RepID=UPI001E2E11BB|nr:MauE/DoxX family redox-associated membrane protein [Nocardioides sambongensis]
MERVGRAWPWVGLLARLVTGGVWLVAGALKVTTPEESINAVRAYQLLPPAVADLVGLVLPALEIAVGLALILGVLTRAAALVSSVLFVAFIVGIASVWARGIEIDCGCFGGGGAEAGAADAYPWEIARDAALLAASLLVLVLRRTALALDNVLFPDHTHDSRPRPCSTPRRADRRRKAEPMASTSKKAAERQAKAAAARAEQKRREQRRRVLTIGGVVLAMAVIVGGAIWISVSNTEEVDAAPAGASEFGVTIGEEDAPHTVVIYEDFLCPYCGALEGETRDDLTQLAADGKVYVEYRPFDLLSDSFGDYPIRAANAFAVVLDAAGAEVAKEYHDLLFENQPSEQDPDAMTDDDLVDLAVEAGADEADVRDGIEGLTEEQWVTDATEEAKNAGVTGTPTVLLDGEQFTDGRTVQDLADNLVAELE